MNDAVLEAFLQRQVDEGRALVRDSDLVNLHPLGHPADRFLVRFTCRGLVRTSTGAIAEAEDFRVGIRFPADYLRCVDPFQALTWLGPRSVWHPNIAFDAPLICVGRLPPGTGLVDLIYQCWEIITWRKVTMREDDALNPGACQWARANLSRFPVDTRPMKRRTLDLHVAEVCRGGHDHAAE